MEELYNKLFEAGDYTKSFEEFTDQYGDDEKSKKLYEGLSSDGSYTKSFEEFKSKYGFGEKKKIQSLLLQMGKRFLRNLLPKQKYKMVFRIL